MSDYITLTGEDIFYFIDVIRDINNVDKLLNYIETPSEKGYIIERLFELFYIFKILKCDYVLQGTLDNMKKITNFKKYLSQKKIISGNSDGVADIKVFKNDKYLLLSSKFFKEEKSIKKYETDSIRTTAIDCNLKYELGLVVKNKEELLNKKINNSEYKLKLNQINKEHIYDLTDIRKLYFELHNLVCKLKTENQIIEYLSSDKKLLDLRLHQRYIVNKIKEYYGKHKGMLLINAICRSGKTFIIGGYISEMNIKKILWITPRKTDTLGSYKKMIDKYSNFNNYAVEDMLKGNKNFIFNENNIYTKTKHEYLITIVSRQMLDKDYIIDATEYDLIIIDESHVFNTPKCEKFVNDYKNTKPIIMMTGTADKTISRYNFNKKNIITFGLNDIDILSSIDTMVDFDKTFMKSFIARKSDLELKTISDSYKSFPRLKYYNVKFDWKKHNIIRDDGYHFLFTKLFLVKNNKFIHEDSVLNLMQYIFGLVYDRTPSIIQKIKYSHRLKRDIILVYLPGGVQGLITAKIQNALINLMEKYPDFSKKYNILPISSAETSAKNKEDIGAYIINTFKSSKKKQQSLIVLTNSMLEVGTSIPEVNIAVKLTDTNSLDRVIQQNFRTGTETLTKKFGLIVDFNPHRTLKTILKVYKTSKNKTGIKDILKKIASEKMIETFDTDFNIEEVSEDMIEKLYTEDLNNNNDLNNKKIYVDLQGLSKLNNTEQKALHSIIDNDNDELNKIIAQKVFENEVDKEIAENIKKDIYEMEKVTKTKTDLEYKKITEKNNTILENLLKDPKKISDRFNQIINIFGISKDLELEEEKYLDKITFEEVSEEEEKDEDPVDEVTRYKKTEEMKSGNTSKKKLYEQCVERGFTTNYKLASITKKELKDCLKNNTELRQKKSKK